MSSKEELWKYIPSVFGAVGVIAAAYFYQKTQEGEAVVARPISYKLRYFNIRGRGEQIRLLLAEIGVKWEDTPEGNYKGDTTFGQLPVLYATHADGFTEEIPQSMAILRYMSRLYGYYGSNEAERTKVDYLSDGINDWRTTFCVAGGYPNYGRNQDENAKYLNTLMPTHAAIYERILSHSSSGFLVGHRMSFVDVQLLALLHQHIAVNIFPQSLDKYPFLKKFVQFMENRPNIKTYLISSNRRGHDLPR